MGYSRKDLHSPYGGNFCHFGGGLLTSDKNVLGCQKGVGSCGNFHDFSVLV
jgi:hypothetical protein